VHDECSFQCDADEFCPVESKDCAGGVANWSLSHGYYDWCVYEPYRTYESLSAIDKQHLLLAKINSTRSGYSPSYPSTAKVFSRLVGASVMLSFDAVADVFPHKRTKYIHSVGTVGSISFDSTGDHPYRGIFEGSSTGLVRFSSGKEFGPGGYSPSMALKFLRDGRPSANFVAMYSLDGQTYDERNFFQHEWSNHLSMTENFGLKLLSKKFWQGSYCPLMVGLSDLASPSESEFAAPGTFPFQLIFIPLVSSDCTFSYSYCLAELDRLEPGTPLFEVFALSSPGSERRNIGNITLRSHLAGASSFGDERLFFKHQRMEDDFNLHPEWLEDLMALDFKAQCGMSFSSMAKPSIEQGCNSPFKGLSSDMTV